MNRNALHALSDGTYRARWIAEVLRSTLTESVKVLLLALAIEEMDEAGLVSEPREVIAARIGRGKSRVSERIQEAMNAGFLVRLSAGKKGNTAVYAAAIGGVVCADLGFAHHPGKGPDSRTEYDPIRSGQADPINGPATRTRTFFGSGLQDALNDRTVRLSGPNTAKKGPLIRDANREIHVEVSKDLQGENEDHTVRSREGAASRPNSTKIKKPAAPKTPIPEDFAVDDDMRAWARDNCPQVDIDLQTRLFVNYFLDKPHIKRPGWVRSWKSWMLRQQNWDQQRNHARTTSTNRQHTPFRNPTNTAAYYEDL